MSRITPLPMGWGPMASSSSAADTVVATLGNRLTHYVNAEYEAPTEETGGVGTWAGIDGRAGFSQSASGNRPGTTTVSGKEAVSFNESNTDHMDADISDAATNSFLWVMAASFPSAPGNGERIASVGSDGVNEYPNGNLLVKNSSGLTVELAGDTDRFDFAVPTTGTWFVHAIHAVAGVTSLSLDGTVYETDTCSNIFASGEIIRLGYGLDRKPTTINIGAALLAKGTISTSEATTVINAIKTYYGVS